MGKSAEAGVSSRQEVSGPPRWKITSTDARASLVVQWKRTSLPMQGMQVRFLVREDPAYSRVSVSHDYCRDWDPQLLKPRTHLESALHNKRHHGDEKSTMRAPTL